MKLTREFKTGAIAVLVFALSIWGYNFLKGKNIIKPTDEYFIRYNNIEGLIESGTVFYKGYKVGNINEIIFNSNKPGEFIVKFVLENRIKIPLGSKVVAKSSNPIASTKDLEIIFTESSTFHQSGDTLLGGYDKGLLGTLEPIQNQLEQTISSLNGTLSALNNTLNEKTQNNLQNTIASLSLTTQRLSALLHPNGKLMNSMDNVESITSNLKDNNESIAEIVQNMSGITADLDSANLQQAITNLDSTLSATSNILAKVNNGEGTAGLLVNDSSLYNNLAAASASLDSLLSDMKDHPKRYVHFSVFGKKDK